jgi:hypothetical protein
VSVLIVADNNVLSAHCRCYNTIYDRLRPVCFTSGKWHRSTVQSRTLIGDKQSNSKQRLYSIQL